MKTEIDSEGVKWFMDDWGNKCSVTYFGTEEKAICALQSLKNCKNCINCSDCYNCYNCSHCCDCHHCSDCYICFRCCDCHHCSDCSHCFDCHRCSDCSRCHNCSHCHNCSDCYGRNSVKGDFIFPETPVIKNIHQEILNAVSQPNAFDMSAWHTCETTHCRAGWVLHLAGEAGKKLEEFYGTALAAQLIYKKSSPFEVSPVRFFEDNETAMADIKRMAELEKKEA